MYVQNTDFLARAQTVYPGAYALEVDSRRKVVLVHCDPCSGNHRDIPGGTVRLGTSPTTAALAREILAATGQPEPDENEGPELPYAGYESDAALRRMAEVRALRAKGQG